MQILGVIPARYASSRFPGKPLAMIEGKSMLQRVYEQASKSRSLSRVIVATDDARIARHVQDFNGEVILTSDQHPSGTDRCAEVAQKFGLFSSGVSTGTHLPPSYLMNIQGDEPFIDPSQIDTLAEVLHDGKSQIATLIIEADRQDVLFDTGEVKVVLNPQREALYFSRSVIPFLKDVPEQEWHLRHTYYRHVGMYAYRCDVLEQLTKLPVSSLEKAESLEQLRWLEAGYKVTCALTRHDSHCIDRPEDIEKVLMLMKEQRGG
ncbi:MAG: 3-deoxy-manno-octulosonate cytidylyltransferase [Bacteroidetes bacterium]|nr:3-deoxy-manno-octulosonate cytidylyltransferase [Bacteroidota bacterium]MBS1629209.1 3-deoxy-manno-octulosonate cytidylyltransferase [Bacteroidota bacterium]